MYSWLQATVGQGRASLGRSLLRVLAEVESLSKSLAEITWAELSASGKPSISPSSSVRAANEDSCVRFKAQDLDAVYLCWAYCVSL